MDTAAAKEALDSAVEDRADRLVEISRSIFGTPELAFEEHHAHAVLTDAIEAEGLDVTRGACGLETAFVAEAGSSGPHIGIVCEYDALPEIGHACGHNVIAAAGLGAGLAAASLADQLGGRIRILGTPAEEGGGGKVYMIDRGAFDGLEAAMMVHPADNELLSMDVIAIHQLRVTFTGAAAHAAAAPEKGRNALDAAVLGYQNVAALRQHIASDERIHGIFTRAGDKPNIVPETTEMVWYVRSPQLDSLAVLRDRVLACLQAGALATGCEIDHTWVDPVYADMVDNAPLLELYAANGAGLGREPVMPDASARVVGSTDMGNVSHVVASIHPMIKVAPAGVPIHTPAFAAHAGGEAGDRAVIDGAKMMARTVADLLLQPDALGAVRAAHDLAG